MVDALKEYAMKTLTLTFFLGLALVTFGQGNVKTESQLSNAKEAANKIRTAILTEENDKIESKLRDLIESTPAKTDCLKAKASQARDNVVWALETYIDPLLKEIERKDASRHDRRLDYFVKYIEERTQSAVTYAQTEADAATRSFASETLNC